MVYTPQTWTNGAGGGTPLSAARLGVIEAGIAAAGTPPVVNVKDHGVTGDGSTDDTVALQACVDAADAGSTIFFPPGTYLISAPITMKDSCSYLGAGRSTASASVIKQKNSANITGPHGRTGLFVSSAFSTDAAVCSNPVLVQGLAFDGNKANNGSSNASGVLLNGFWSTITDCYFTNLPYAGVLLSDYTNDGTYVSNSCSENRLSNLKIDGCPSSGIEQESGNGNSNLDGFITDCYISDVGDGIYMSKAAGWSIRRNHIYGVQLGGIHLGACYATTVTENYIEDFGTQNTASAYYKGIDLEILAGWPSFITNNFVCNQVTTGTAHFRNFQIVAAYDAQARAVISGNIAVCNSSGIDTKAFYLDRSGAGVLTAQVGGNMGFGAATEWYVDGSCVTSWDGAA